MLSPGAGSRELGWHAPATPERHWKVFVAVDGLLFSEGSAPAPSARRERLQGRLRRILAGQWDAAWLSMEDQTRRGPAAGRGREGELEAR
eukprot:1206072-Pyramimonas_sp.AAC.1